MQARQIPTHLALMMADAMAFIGAASAAWWLKSLTDPTLSIEVYAQILPFALGGLLAILTLLGLYPGIGVSAASELKRLSHGVTILIVTAIALTFLGQKNQDWSRQVFVSTWAISLVAIPVFRALIRRTCSNAHWWGIPVVVMGAGATGAQVITLLRSRPWMGLRPVAVLDDSPTKQKTDIQGVPVIGTLSDIDQLRTHRITHAILAIPSLPAENCARLLDQLSDHVRHVFLVPALPGSPDVIAETREFANTLVLEVQQNLLRPEARILKRTLDIIAVLIAFSAFWWLFTALALAVRCSSPGPVFYGQRRIGRDGAMFTAWKFRSMVQDADARLHSYLESHPELLAEWERDHKLKNDPRVTWVGSLLRRTSLDELPQFWNVLLGDMSLVGPRPIVQAEVAKYGDRFALYQKVRPGLSGLWQVSGRNDTTYAERIALDCYYVRNWSVWLDLVIIARTVRVVLWGKGAY